MTYREQALLYAIAEIGVRESPSGSNSGPRVNEYLASAGLGPGYPWCMAFLHFCFRRAGLVLDHPNLASVGFFESWARSNGYLVPTPERGDLVCYRFDGDDWPDHVGIVERVEGGTIYTVEGNTALGNDANGGMVMRRSRPLHRVKFARIPGQAAPTPDPQEAPNVYPWLEDWLRWNFHGRNEGAPRPANVPAAIPADALSVSKTIESIVKLTGPPIVYQGWRDARLVGDVEAPAGTPVPVPKRWWAGATADHSFANRYAEKLVAAVSAEKALIVTQLQEQIDALELALDADGATDAERDAEIGALLEQALDRLRREQA